MKFSKQNTSPADLQKKIPVERSDSTAALPGLRSMLKPKRTPMNKLILFYLMMMAGTCSAQLPDHIYQPSIHAVKLFKSGDQLAYPILTLNGSDQLELHFDDLDADVKSLYYTFQLCNADWTLSTLQPFDYIRGFQSTRISTYRNSSIAQVRYTHYQAAVPDRSSVPTRSGNYLLKVFRNSDTSDLFYPPIPGSR